MVGPNVRKNTRGYFDVVKPEGDALRVVGWMFRLSPGGLLLATVHGEFAALFTFSDRAPRNPLGRIAERLGLRPIIPGDIIDSTRDHALDGVAPSEYYRGVYQTRNYTVRE